MSMRPAVTVAANAARSGRAAHVVAYRQHVAARGVASSSSWRGQGRAVRLVGLNCTVERSAPQLRSLGRLSLTLRRCFTADVSRAEADKKHAQQAAAEQQAEQHDAASSSSGPSQGQPIGQIDPKLSLTFTCTVPDCGHRSTHQFSKRSYERGIVLVQCPGCKNRHLIADHLGWFKQTAGEPRTVEDIVRQHGGRVRRGIQHGQSDTGDGDYETVEILSDSHAQEDISSSNGDNDAPSGTERNRQ